MCNTLTASARYIPHSLRKELQLFVAAQAFGGGEGRKPRIARERLLHPALRGSSPTAATVPTGQAAQATG